MKMLKDNIFSCLSFLHFSISFSEGQSKFVDIITEPETLQLAGDDEEGTGVEDAVTCHVKQTGDFHTQWRLMTQHLTTTSQLAHLGMQLYESSVYELALTAFAMTLDAAALKQIRKQHELSDQVAKIFTKKTKHESAEVEDDDDDNDNPEPAPAQAGKKIHSRRSNSKRSHLSFNLLHLRSDSIPPVPAASEIVGKLCNVLHKPHGKCSTCDPSCKDTRHKHFECPVAYKLKTTHNLPGLIADTDNKICVRDPVCWLHDGKTIWSH